MVQSHDHISVREKEWSGKIERGDHSPRPRIPCHFFITALVFTYWAPPCCVPLGGLSSYHLQDLASTESLPSFLVHEPQVLRKIYSLACVYSSMCVLAFHGFGAGVSPCAQDGLQQYRPGWLLLMTIVKVLGVDCCYHWYHHTAFISCVSYAWRPLLSADRQTGPLLGRTYSLGWLWVSKCKECWKTITSVLKEGNPKHFIVNN